MIEGVSYLHRMERVHGDLKPENILLTEKMVTKISDFGSMKKIELQTSLKMTMINYTLKYVSPEVFEEKGVQF